MDQSLRRLERRYRTGLRPVWQGAGRQGHVGDAGPNGRYAEAKNRASEGRGKHRVGTLTDCGDVACLALSPGRRRGAAARTRLAAAGKTLRYFDHPAVAI